MKFSCTHCARCALFARSKYRCSASSTNFFASAKVGVAILADTFAAGASCPIAHGVKTRPASAHASKPALFIVSILMRPSSVTSPRNLSAPPAPGPPPPGPRRNASPPAPNTAPYPAPRRHADAAHRKFPPPSFPFSCSQKSQCLSALSSDRSPGRESPRCLPPATSHFHDRHAVAPATSPAQSTPLRRSLLLAASRLQTFSGKSAPFQ